jgi:hypothetical protein
MIRYVGKSDSPLRRYKEHLKGEDLKTYKTSWIKKLIYHNKTPILKILEIVKISDWEKAEIKWIAHYRIISGNKLTNYANGGNAPPPLTPESLAKTRASKKGKTQSKETRLKHSEDMKKRWANPEFRKNQSKKRRGQTRSKETCKNISEALKKSYQNNPELRKFQSRPETVKKQSETSKKVWTPERKKEHAKILKKLWKDNPELRERQSQISKKMWLNPEHKKIISDSGKKRWNDPELKKKLSVESKERWKNSEYREKRQSTINNKKQGILNGT